MQFSNTTYIAPDAFKDDIPIIHGQNYYINELAQVCTYTYNNVNVYDTTGEAVTVTNLNEITDFIYVINNKLSFMTSEGIIVTDLDATKQNYRGGFQGIVGWDDNATEYQFQNNTTAQSTVSLTGRINNSKQLEIQIGDLWVVPLGEFRCYINNTFYNINYNTVLPNTFGDTFTVTIAGWTTVTEKLEATNYITDALIQGNTLYLMTRTKFIGSEPFSWNVIDTAEKTVIWSEDSRLVGTKIYGEPTGSQIFCVDYNTNTIYFVDGVNDLSILQSYEHNLKITGANYIDKQLIAIVDKEGITVQYFYVSLNNYLQKTAASMKFNQMSAYEDLINTNQIETVEFVKSLRSIVITSTQRASMLIFMNGNNIQSICHTNSDAIPGSNYMYRVVGSDLMRYGLTEDNGYYTDLNDDNILDFQDNFIYIGSDLEPDVGGSTLEDTEIKFEGKIAIISDDEVLVESSGDKPESVDLPVRTNQVNPSNEWYLYSKTLRMPFSYTDWIKITMMPTTKILSISLTDYFGNNGTSKKNKRK